MVFGKKKERAVDADVSAKKKEKKPVVKAKKKKGGMNQIFHESVWETVLNDLKMNEPFTQVEDGKPKYVGLCLKADDIGGLDKKSKKDEAKGSIIECINSGRIKTYITSELLDENSLVIIPDALTLAAMDEFSLLTDAPYEFCCMHLNGDIDLLGVQTTYLEVANLVSDEGHVDELLGDEDEDSSSSVMDDDEDVVDDEDDNEPAAIEVPAVDDTDDVDDIDMVDDLDDIEALDEDTGFVGQPEVAMDDMSEPEPDPYQAAMEEPPAQQVEDEVPSEWTTEAVTRKFYSDDLGLEVSTEPFDAQFMSQNLFVPFDENRPDGWLNNQLNEMCRAANVEMNRMHQGNLFLMRERYFRLISMLCDRIQQDLDITSMDTQYGQLYQQLLMDKNDDMSNVEALVSRKKDEIEELWKRKLQEVGMDAARAAQHQYRERYGKQHEAQLFGIEAMVKASVDADFQDGKHELFERRKMEASALLDLGITEVLDEISDMYVSSIEDERIRYEELQRGMQAFLDDNRQADIARTKALSEELRQTNQADRVLAEQTQKIRELTEEYSSKKKELMSDIAAMRDENEKRLRACEDDAKRRVARAEEETQNIQKQFNELLNKYQNLDEMKSHQFEKQLAEKDDEIEAWKDRNHHMEEVHKRNSLLATFLIIAITIAAISIGFIGGEYVSSSRQTNMDYESLLQDNVPTGDAVK